MKSFKLLLTCTSSSPEVLFQGRVLRGCAADFRGPICVCECDFNEVAKRLLLRLRFCIVVLLSACFMFVEHLS